MRITVIGGIGSGKSEAIKAAAELGIHTLSADEINSKLLCDADYIREIAAGFPQAVKDGAVDRRLLADIVFSDSAALKKLNSIAHPKILKRITDDISAPLAVEMPLLYEIGAQNLFDEIVLIYTPIGLRLERLKQRGMDTAQAERRIKAQADGESLKAAATRIIDNSGSLSELRDNARVVFSELTKNNIDLE